MRCCMSAVVINNKKGRDEKKREEKKPIDISRLANVGLRLAVPMC